MISILDIIIPNDNKKISIITKILFLLIIMLFPFGMIFMLRGMAVPDHTWIATVYLSIIAVTSAVYLVSITEKVPSLFFIGAVFILATVAEAVGLSTGYPFGHYIYSDYFIPFLPGGVPLAITFSWLIVTINAFLICRLLVDKPKNPFIVPFAAALIILAFDVLLEPFGSFINKYWIWENNFVPVQNFVSWFILGFMFTYMLERTVKFVPNSIQSRMIGMPVILLGILVLQFVIINFSRGYWLYSLVGLFTILAVIRSVKRKYVGTVK